MTTIKEREFKKDQAQLIAKHFTDISLVADLTGVPQKGVGSNPHPVEALVSEHTKTTYNCHNTKCSASSLSHKFLQILLTTNILVCQYCGWQLHGWFGARMEFVLPVPLYFWSPGSYAHKLPLSLFEFMSQFLIFSKSWNMQLLSWPRNAPRILVLAPQYEYIKLDLKL